MSRHAADGGQGEIPTQKGRQNDLPMSNLLTGLIGELRFNDYEPDNTAYECPGPSKAVFGFQLESITSADPDD